MILALAAALVPVLGNAQGVTVKGSDTMVILAQRWAENYMKANAGKRVQVTGGGSGIGIAALVNGTTEIANASRPMKEGEKSKVRDRYNVLPTEISVAKDGLAVYVQESNPVEQLTLEQLKGIYVGDITNWKDVGVRTPRSSSTPRELVGHVVFFKGQRAQGGRLRRERPDPPRHRPGVNANRQGEVRHRLRRRRVRQGREGGQARREGRQGLPADRENVASGKYPLSRDLFMYTRGKPSARPRSSSTSAFRRPQAIVTTVGYFPVK